MRGIPNRQSPEIAPVKAAIAGNQPGGGLGGMGPDQKICDDAVALAARFAILPPRLTGSVGGGSSDRFHLHADFLQNRIELGF